jgi:hypothetical protein
LTLIFRNVYGIFYLWNYLKIIGNSRTGRTTMKIHLLEKKCRSCGVKLTEFEIEEKESFCMECYEEQDKEVTE